MNLGIWIDNQNFLPVQDLIELAVEIEEFGWDGIFLSDSPGWEEGYMDPIVLLSAIASRTSIVKLGSWIIPLPLHNPQDIALQFATLDQVSGGRAILGVGSGGGPDYKVIGLPEDIKTRASMLDEGLEIIDKLWSGKKVDYAGEFYKIDGLQLKTTPKQFPRIPVVIAGTWPAKKPFQRGARWDGMMPNPITEVDKIREMVNYYRSEGDGKIFLAIPFKFLNDETVMETIEELKIEWVIVTGLIRKDKESEKLVIERELIEQIPA